MRRIMLVGKIHRARVTEADLNYEGSLTVDRNLLEAADMLPYQQIQVYNVSNGARFETYLMEGEAGSGIICANGAAARMAHPGDLLIIAAYALLPEEAARRLKPKVVLVDRQNQMVGASLPLNGDKAKVELLR
jgi:aspartate 1-decarboxylase